MKLQHLGLCQEYNFRSLPQYFHCLVSRTNLLALRCLCFLFLYLQVTFQTKPCHQQAPCPGFRALSATSTTPASTARHQGRQWAKLATLTTPCRQKLVVEVKTWAAVQSAGVYQRIIACRIKQPKIAQNINKLQSVKIYVRI